MIEHVESIIYAGELLGYLNKQQLRYLIRNNFISNDLKPKQLAKMLWRCNNKVMEFESWNQYFVWSLSLYIGLGQYVDISIDGNTIDFKYRAYYHRDYGGHKYMPFKGKVAFDDSKVKTMVHCKTSDELYDIIKTLKRDE
jgi:hypothetical protein